MHNSRLTPSRKTTTNRWLRKVITTRKCEEERQNLLSKYWKSIEMKFDARERKDEEFPQKFDFRLPCVSLRVYASCLRSLEHEKGFCVEMRRTNPSLSVFFRHQGRSVFNIKIWILSFPKRKFFFTFWIVLDWLCQTIFVVFLPLEQDACEQETMTRYGSCSLQILFFNYPVTCQWFFFGRIHKFAHVEFVWPKYQSMHQSKSILKSYYEFNIAR